MVGSMGIDYGDGVFYIQPTKVCCLNEGGS